MDMKHFWTHKDNIPEGYGYGQFTPAHYGLIVFTVLLTIVTTVAYGASNAHTRIVILRTIAATLIISDIIKMIVIALSPVKFSDYLPLELCSFAAYSIVCDSIVPDNTFFPVLLVTLFLPAAIMAIIFPTTTPLPVFNFHSIHQFLFHGLIVAYVMARFINGEIPLSYPMVWSAILKASVLVGIMYVVDTVFDKNFMFLRDTYGNAMLGAIEKVTGKGIPYVFGLVCFSVFMIHVFFFIFKIIEILFIR